LKITLKPHGIFSDILGYGNLTVSDVRNTQELKKYISTEYPATEKYMYRIAVNKTLAVPEATFEDGDSIDLIPPFPGG
jgi:molybdopterin converting factor small subunit